MGSRFTPNSSGDETLRPTAWSLALWLVGLLALAGGALWAAWTWLPDFFVVPSDYTIPQGRQTVVDEAALDAAQAPLRASLGLLVVGVLAAWTAVAGVFVNMRNTELTRRGQAAAALRDNATAELARRGQTSGRYVDALKLLQDDANRVSARVGALYALEQLASQEPADYQQVVTDVVAAYVLDRAACEHWREPAELTEEAALSNDEVAVLAYETATGRDQKGPPQDVLAALRILSRRPRSWIGKGGLLVEEREALDLRRTHLANVDLSQMNFSDTDLSDTCLQGAQLIGANLSSSNLSLARLWAVDLEGACLDNGLLEHAQLGKASLMSASLRNAQLQHADLTDCGLLMANLAGADLTSCVGLDLDELETTTRDAETVLPPEASHLAMPRENGPADNEW